MQNKMDEKKAALEHAYHVISILEDIESSMWERLEEFAENGFCQEWIEAKIESYLILTGAKVEKETLMECMQQQSVQNKLYVLEKELIQTKKEWEWEGNGFRAIGMKEDDFY